MIRLAPFVPFVYVFAWLVAARSEAPLLMDRYSFQAAALIGLGFVTLGVALWAWWYRNQALETLTLAILVLITLVMPGSDAVQRVPLVTYVLPLVRLLAAAALVSGEMARSRRLGAANGPLLAAAAVLAVWASVDVGLAAVTRDALPRGGPGLAGFRRDYALDTIPPDSIVLIGDSFVWGQGVDEVDAFGSRLERHFREAGDSRAVYSLGTVGGGMTAYLATLSRLPAGRPVARIALVYYMNDMPPAPRLVDSVRSQMTTLGVGAPTLRLVGDLAGRAMTPTLDDYYASLVADYDAREPTFDRRWRVLSGQMERFRELASGRSGAAPLLVILPLMVNFADYPLADAHLRLAEVGGRLGFDVLDLLPTFSAQLQDGGRHLAAPGDNHFDAATHALVAQALSTRLARP